MKVLIQAILLTTSCTALASPSIVGKWVHAGESKGGPTTETMQFKGPSTFLQDVAVDKDGTTRRVVSKGTYSLSNGWLVITFKTIKNTYPGVFAKQSLTMPPVTRRLKIKWPDRNHFVALYEGRGIPVTFTRAR